MSSNLGPALRRLTTELVDLMLDRHEKYGPGNISKHGMTGIVVRLGDKMARLENGLENYGDESLEDTLKDIAGYALIGLLWERNQWPGQDVDPADYPVAR